MLEKIDEFINKFLNWKILKYVLLANLCTCIHSLIAARYNISFLHMLLMNISFGLGISFFEKSIFEFFR